MAAARRMSEPMNVVPEINGKVLAVDDNHANLALLARILESEGHLVRTTDDGMSALDAVETDPPDVIILDVRLPDIDGFEVCRRLKQNPSTRLTPVIMITGLDSRDHRIESIKAGADDFLGSRSILPSYAPAFAPCFG
jgi:DNA-binding response OmpR family regulator